MNNTIVNPNYKPYTRSTKENYKMAYRLLRIIKKDSVNADSERLSYFGFPDSIKDNAMESIKSKSDNVIGSVYRARMGNVDGYKFAVLFPNHVNPQRSMKAYYSAKEAYESMINEFTSAKLTGYNTLEKEIVKRVQNRQ